MKILNSLHDTSKDITKVHVRIPSLAGNKFVQSQKVRNNVLRVLLGEIARVDMKLGGLFWVFATKRKPDALLDLLNKKCGTLVLT